MQVYVPQLLRSGQRHIGTVVFVTVGIVVLSGSVSSWMWTLSRSVVLRYSESGMAATSCRG